MLISLLLLFKILLTQSNGSEYVKYKALQASALQNRLPPLPLHFDVYGSIFDTAYYYLILGLGAPKVQEQSFIFDTGSSTFATVCDICEDCGEGHWDQPLDIKISKYLLGKPCSSCSNCRLTLNDESLNTLAKLTKDVNHESKEFHDIISKSAKEDEKLLQCGYDVSYAEGSKISGIYYRDILWLNTVNGDWGKRLEEDSRNVCPVLPSKVGPPIPLLVDFGCHTSETYLFKQQKASGIVGFEFWGDASVQPFPTAVLTELKELYESDKLVVIDDYCSQDQQKNFRFSFSTCFSHSGGSLAFAGSHQRYRVPEAPVLTIPLVSRKDEVTSYTIGLEGIDASVIGKLSPEMHSPAFYTMLANKKNWTPIQLKPEYFVTEKDKRTSRKISIIPTLLDSGTTLSYFSPRIFKDMLITIENRVNINAKTRMRNLKSVKTTFIPKFDSGYGKIFEVNGEPPLIMQRLMNRRDKRDNNKLMFVPVGTNLITEAPKRLLNLSNLSSSDISSSLRAEVEEKIKKLSESDSRQLQYNDSSWFVVFEPTGLQSTNIETTNFELIGFVNIPRMMQAASPRKPVDKVDKNGIGECWWLQNKEADLSLFPTFRFKFYGSPNYLTWHPYNYLYSGKNPHFWCLGIMSNGVGGESNDSSNEAVFGSNAFINKDITFATDDLGKFDYESLKDYDSNVHSMYVNEKAYIEITDANCPIKQN